MKLLIVLLLAGTALAQQTVYSEGGAWLPNDNQHPKGTWLFDGPGTVTFNKTVVSSGANTWTGAQTLGTAGNTETVLKIPSTDVSTVYGGAPFGISHGTGVFNSTTDNVMDFGYNMFQQNPIVPGLPYMGYQTEVDFNDGTHHWMEQHFDYSVDGVTNFRPLTIGTYLTDGTHTDITLAFGSDATSAFGILSNTTQLWKMLKDGAWECSVCSASVNQQFLQWGGNADFMNSLGVAQALQISAGHNGVQYNFYPAATGFFNNASAPLGSASSPWGDVTSTGYDVPIKVTSLTLAGQPVKIDTSNPSQVVPTTTTDTGAGVVVGIWSGANTGAGGTGKMMVMGTNSSAVMGTGTCTVGQFVIVDTTTTGDVKCTGTYTAGTVIGKALTAQSTVGGTVTVLVGLR